MKERIIYWYLTNFKLISTVLNSPVIYDQETFSWMRVERFPLPPHFTPPATKFLLVLPGLANIENKHKFEFYLYKNIKRLDGKSIKHFYAEGFYNPFAHKGYARFSFHVDYWKPSLNPKQGTNLLDICQAFYNFLARK